MVMQEEQNLELLASRALETGIIDHFELTDRRIILRIEGEVLELEKREARKFLGVALEALEMNPPPRRKG